MKFALIIFTLFFSFFFPQAGNAVDPSRELPLTSETRQVNLHRAIERYTRQYRLPSEELFASLLIIESNLNPCSTSIVGAAGLTQLMPQAAQHMGITDRFEIHQNLWGGASVLKTALNMADGDITKSLGLYYWGKESLSTPFKSWPEDTQAYVNKISKTQDQFKAGGWKRYIPKYIPYQDSKTCNLS